MSTLSLRTRPDKRRNLTRWQENRLRRLDAKIARAGRADGVCDMSPESVNRCRDRAHRLAHEVQEAWSKRKTS
jgi:hypothetical protein